MGEFPPMEKLNWLIHLQHVRGEISSCKELINEEIARSYGKNQYALFKQVSVSSRGGSKDNLLVLLGGHPQGPGPCPECPGHLPEVPEVEPAEPHCFKGSGQLSVSVIELCCYETFEKNVLDMKWGAIGSPSTLF